MIAAVQLLRLVYHSGKEVYATGWRWDKIHKFIYVHGKIGQPVFSFDARISWGVKASQ